MELFTTWWFTGASVVISFIAVFIVCHNPKWPSPTMYGVIVGTVLGLISLFIYLYMTLLLLFFALGTFIGYIVDLVLRKSKKNYIKH